MRIDVVSDTICPWCYIGKRRLERALAARAGEPAAIGWRPFQLNPDMPADGMERQAYLALKFGGAGRAERIYAPIVEAGAGEGIAFAFERIARTPNTLLSHRLIGLAGRHGRQDAAVEALFRAYFVEGRDIGDRDVLADLALEAGLDRAEAAGFLEAEDGLAEIEAEDALARRLGIAGVPCFIIDRAVMISGAQTPAAFDEAFALAAERAAVPPSDP